jgi:hypothetical protein
MFRQHHTLSAAVTRRLLCGLELLSQRDAGIADWRPLVLMNCQATCKLLPGGPFPHRERRDVVAKLRVTSRAITRLLYVDVAIHALRISDRLAGVQLVTRNADKVCSHFAFLRLTPGWPTFVNSTPGGF